MTYIRFASATVMGFACLYIDVTVHDVNVTVHAFQPKPYIYPFSFTRVSATASARRPAIAITELNVASVMRSSSSKVPAKQPHDDSSNIDAAISQLHVPSSSSLASNPSNDLLLGNMHSVLDDGQGHMNADLARAIWEWENAIRLEDEETTSSRSHSNTNTKTSPPLPKSPKVLQYPASQLKFSTRQGLRMIHEIALEVLDIELEDGVVDHTTSTDMDASTSASPTNYADLVQEGVVALMSAMAEADVNEHDKEDDQYDNDNDATTTTTTTSRTQLFEVKAREAIRDVMVKAQSKIRTPRAFPSVVFDALNHKHQSSMSISKSSSKSKQDDNELDANANTNRGLNNKATVSETLRVLQEEDTTDVDVHVDADTTTTQSLNTALVQPLASLLQHSNPTPDEVALSDMIRHDLDGFLKRTLTPKELAVIRLKFGLEVTSTTSTSTTGRQETSCGRGWNVETIGEVMELSKEDVIELETQALEKLRTCFRNDYIGAYLDDDPATEEVSL